MAKTSGEILDGDHAEWTRNKVSKILPWALSPPNFSPSFPRSDGDPTRPKISSVPRHSASIRPSLSSEVTHQAHHERSRTIAGSSIVQRSSGARFSPDLDVKFRPCGAIQAWTPVIAGGFFLLTAQIIDDQPGLLRCVGRRRSKGTAGVVSTSKIAFLAPLPRDSWQSGIPFFQPQ